MNNIENIKTTDLNTKDTGGVIGKPVFNTDGDIYGKIMTADTTNSDAAQINITASEENRSAKWKNGESIDRKAGVPEKGQDQYMY